MLNGISTLLVIYIGMALAALLLELLYRLLPGVWESVAGWMEGKENNAPAPAATGTSAGAE